MKNIIYILLSTVLLVACSNDEKLVLDNFYASEDSPLTFTMQAPSISGEEEMNFNKEGLEGYFGLTLQGKDGGYYDDKDYNNMPYQRNGDEWISISEELMISNSEGHLFAYYPYNETITNIKQLPIVVDDSQTDYLYAAPIVVSSVNSRVSLSFHHALAVLEVDIARNTNVADSKLKSISISGSGIGTTGVLDVTTGIVTPTNSGQEIVVTYNDEYVPTVDEVEADNTKALKKYILLVPNQLENGKPTGLDAGKISIKVKMDDTTYKLDTKRAVTLKQNALYKCKVTSITSDTFISETENLTFVNDRGKQEYNVKNITGIMITDKEYLPGNHKMIVRTTFNSDPVKWRITNDPFVDIPYFSTSDGSNSYVVIFDGTSTDFPHISDGSWLGSEGALNDFDGKSNTAAMIKANGGYEGDEYPIIKANATALKEGWYIPSLGQLAVIYKYRNQLNAELHRIKAAGGNVDDVISGGYALNWSSTTNGGGSAWVVYFDCGICGTRMQIDESWTRNPNLVRDVE
ncbi:fimbrillin family protein [Bacteroides zhangwenhongii]|uniref:fimbrillin family protein n=1 Tax=Bacteroides zhangwenhongii TaxID=2650157 RepID=UPI0022E84AC6|nr:fimbrillin family protein [Bacteroides zhangwenhongii]